MNEIHAALLTDRRILRASGPEAKALLQRVVTGNVDKVTPGTGVYSLLLTAQGKFLFDFFLVADPAGGDGILMDVGASRADDLLKRFNMYKLRAKADFDDASDEFAVAAVWGGEAGDIAGGESYPDPRFAALGTRLVLPAADAEAVLAKTGFDIVDPEAYRAFTIAMGVPDGAQDIRVEGDFPIECNLDLLNGIDFKKGCFVGQEVASRAHRKGKARKRLVHAEIAGAAPEAGSDVTVEGSKVGTIAGTYDSHALALIFLDRIAKAGTVAATAGETQLALEVPPYAAFSLTDVEAET